jgi:acetyl esterase/lipase
VDYRVAPAVHPAPVQDVAHAVAWIRAHAEEYHVNPNAIAVMGFSAGGHAAGSLGVYWHDAALMADAGLTPEQARPNAMVLCYPVITGGEFAHRGSFVNLTGTEDLAVHAEYSLETKVTAQTPPTFLWHTFEDGAVPVENTLMMASVLRRAGVVTEVHIFPKGGHGLALCNPLTSTDPGQNLPECAQWTKMAACFLETVM